MEQDAQHTNIVAAQVVAMRIMMTAGIIMATDCQYGICGISGSSFCLF